MLIFFAACTQFRVATAQNVSKVHEPSADLTPPCDHPPVAYLGPPDPDLIGDYLKAHKRYRLVIGAGEYLDHPEINNRDYVGPTARLGRESVY